MLLALALTLLAAPVQATETATTDSNSEEDCHTVWIAPWPPYVFVDPDCPPLESKGDQPTP